MYKTVRHGENSLQYTILPQNDDFRMDCKLSSAESSCSSSTIKARKQAKSKRPRRRTFFAYLGLIFICTVIVGAVLIPFLVSAECLPNPTDWFLKSKAAFMRNHFQRFEYNTNTHKNNHNNINNKNNNKTDNKNNIVNTNANNHDMNVENLGKHVQIINNNNSMDTIILHLNKTYNNNNNNKSNKNEINMLTSTIASVTKMMNADNKKLVTEVYSLEGDLSTTIINNNDKEKMANYMHSHMNVADTIHSPLIDNNNNNNNNDTSKIIQAPAPDLPAQSAMIMQHQQQQQQQQQQLINNNNDNMPQMNAFVNSPHAPVASSQQFTVTNVQQSQTPAAMPTITTRIIQVPLLKSTAKKPFIPPVLVKSKSYNDLAQHNINADKNNNNNNNNFKMNAHDIEKTAIEATKATQDDVIKHDINNINNNNNNNNNKKWLKAHWPYMDPTTYFQWTGYKAEDSVLLPAILGIVLLVVIIILALLMTAGFKRRLISVVKKRKRNDIEEAGAEDNATLLTSTNLSDED